MPPKKRKSYPGKKKGPDGSFYKKQYVQKQVASYVNKALFLRPRLSERKWYHVGYPNIAVGSGTPLAINPFWLLAQGTSQDARIGLNVSNANIYLDVNYSHFGCSSLAVPKTSASNLRVLIFSNPSKWRQTVYNVMEFPSAGTGTAIPTTDVFLDSGTDRMTHSYTNKDINKILYDSGTIPVGGSGLPQGTVIGYQKTHRCKLKLGDLRWEANANSYLRDNQIYIWIVADYQGYAGIAPATNDQLGNIGLNFLVTYQDS